MRALRLPIRLSALGAKGLLLLAALELAFLATNYSNLFFLLLAFADLAFSLVHATALSAARRASA